MNPGELFRDLCEIIKGQFPKNFSHLFPVVEGNNCQDEITSVKKQACFWQQQCNFINRLHQSDDVNCLFPSFPVSECVYVVGSMCRPSPPVGVLANIDEDSRGPTGLSALNVDLGDVNVSQFLPIIMP